MDWNLLFAARTATMGRSAVRELLKLTEQPGMISFAGGLPAAELFPLDSLRGATRSLLKRPRGQALQYSSTEGLPELRDWIANRYSTASARVTREQVAIVNGGQQGLDLIGRVLLNPGDTVAVENPTYLALLASWRSWGASFRPIVCDAQGMRLDSLREALVHSPKLVYTIPNFQNPQGTTLSADRRVELLRLLQNRDMAIVEDDPYGELRYEGEALPSLLALAQAGSGQGVGQVLYVGTFSKVLMPGLRVGWVIAPEGVIDKIVQAKQAGDLHTSTWSQALVWELLQDGVLETQIPLLREAYRTRRDAMLQALESLAPPGVSWTRPEGGMFLMVKLPKQCDARALLTQALSQQVAFVPGEEFHLDGQGRSTLRLNFSQADPATIKIGIERLCRVLRCFC